jgi:hypothetical protein
MLPHPFKVAIVMAGLLAGSATRAWAQGCILCYTSAAAGGPTVQSALRWGVLALLIPVALLLVAMAVLVWRSAAKPAAPQRPVSS